MFQRRNCSGFVKQIRPHLNTSGLAYLSLGDRNLAVKQSQTLNRLNPSLAKQLTEIINNVSGQR